VFRAVAHAAHAPDRAPAQRA